VKSVRFVEEAQEEFFEQILFYEQREIGLGDRFRAAVEAAVLMAAMHPNMGSPWRQNTRRVFPRDFPYSIVYRAVEAELVVVAIAHFKRRPTYWRGRYDR
jgi:toxin ParE1/3/4